MEYPHIIETKAEEQIEIKSAVLFKFFPLAKDILSPSPTYKFTPTMLSSVALVNDDEVRFNANLDVFSFINSIKNLTRHHVDEIFGIIHYINNILGPIYSKQEIEIDGVSEDGTFIVKSVDQKKTNFNKLLEDIGILKELVELKNRDLDTLEVKFSTKKLSKDRQRDFDGIERSKMYMDGKPVNLTGIAAQSILDIAIDGKINQINSLFNNFIGLKLYFQMQYGKDIDINHSNISEILREIEVYKHEVISKNLFNRFTAKAIVDYLNVEVYKLNRQPDFSINQEEGAFIYGLFFLFGFLDKKDMVKEQNLRYRAEKIRGYFAHDKNTTIGISFSEKK